MDPERTNILIAKYGINNEPSPNSDPIVNSVMDGDQMAARANWGPDNWLLCDPDRSPAMYEIVTNAHRELRASMAAGEVHWEAENEYDPDNPNDNAARSLYAVMVSSLLPG